MMNSDLNARCDAIEECYEFMLAYAAQGVVEEAGSQSKGKGQLAKAKSKGQCLVTCNAWPDL